MKKLLAQAGKKTYTFVMGKLNAAKLANFMEIDMFVLVACPENSLVCTLTDFSCRCACVLFRVSFLAVLTLFRISGWC